MAYIAPWLVGALIGVGASLAGWPYSETDAGRREVADAQARVAALVARAQRRGADRDDNGPVAA